MKNILNYLKCKFLGYCSIDRASEMLGRQQLKKGLTFMLFLVFILSLAQNAFNYITERRMIESLVLLSNKADEYERFINYLQMLDIETKQPIFKDKGLTEYLHNIDTQSYKKDFEHLGKDNAVNKEVQKVLREAFQRELKLQEAHILGR